jgi:hypothetical protein
MSYSDYPDPPEREVLRDEEELLCDLMALYIARREAGAQTLMPHLEARASEFGRQTRDKLEDLIVFYEIGRLIWPDDVAGTQPEGRVRDGLARGSADSQD